MTHAALALATGHELGALDGLANFMLLVLFVGVGFLVLVVLLLVITIRKKRARPPAPPGEVPPMHVVDGKR